MSGWSTARWPRSPSWRPTDANGPVSRVGDRGNTVCDEGYQSSLAAATSQQLGFACATDVDGGFQAWREAGLPLFLPERSALAVRS
jgi:hypothetical protein